MSVRFIIKEFCGAVASWRFAMHNNVLKPLRNPAQGNKSLFNPIFLKFIWPQESLSASGTFEMLWSHQIQVSAIFLILCCHSCLSCVWLDYWSSLIFVMSSWPSSPPFHHYRWNDIPAGHWHLISNIISSLLGLWKMEKYGKWLKLGLPSAFAVTLSLQTVCHWERDEHTLAVN